jgi:hypothetical protein
MRIESNRVANDYEKKPQEAKIQKETVEVNKTFETQLADGVRSDIKQGSITPIVEEIKSANSALAHLSKVNGAMQKISGDKMEGAMEDLRKITNSLKDMLNKNLTAINEPSGASYDAGDVRSRLSTDKNFVSAHNFDYLASKADALLG